MALSLTTASSGVALILGQAVSADQSSDLKTTSLGNMFKSYQQKGGNLTLDGFLAGFQKKFDDLPTGSRSSRSPDTLHQVIFKAAREAEAKLAQEKLDALIQKQQAKMGDGGRHFDPSQQVICHVFEMLISCS